MIELLVVIAIIGILATIILAAVTESRTRAADTKVRAQVTGAKGAAEVYFGANSGYGTSNLSQATGLASCTGDLYSDTNSGMRLYSNAANYPGGTRLICVENLSEFAFAASLSSGSDYWCVDSSGDPGTISISNPSSVTATDDSCTKLDAR